MNSKQYIKFAIITILFTGVVISGSVYAQNRVRGGIRTGIYSNSNSIFLGGEIIAPIGSRWNINPNIEYVFVPHYTYATFNADFVYFAPVDVRNLYIWGGGGLGLVYENPNGPSDGTTNPGINLLGGIGFQAGNIIPYIQPKIILKNDSEFVLTFGIRF